MILVRFSDRSELLQGSYLIFYMILVRKPKNMTLEFLYRLHIYGTKFIFKHNEHTPDSYSQFLTEIYTVS
jgi:hypothetical protein